MGPRSGERGNLAGREKPSVIPRSFNGPRSGERGNDGKHEEKSMRTLRLQWGRAQVSAEIPFLGRYLGLDRLASMGPRSGERGNLIN